MSGIARRLAMLVVCFGVGGLPSAVAEEGYPNQTIPTPQTIPHKHEVGCESGHRDHGWGGDNPAHGGDEGWPRCGGGDGWRGEAEKGPGERHAAKDRCCGEAGREDACASARGDGDAYKSGGLPPQSGLKISQFVLYGERSLHLGDCDWIIGGDVGVRSFAAMAEGSQLRIGRNWFVPVARVGVA